MSVHAKMATLHVIHIYSTRIHVLYIVWVLLSENESYTRLPTSYAKYIARFTMLSISVVFLLTVSRMFKINVTKTEEEQDQPCNTKDIHDDRSTTSWDVKTLWEQARMFIKNKAESLFCFLTTNSPYSEFKYSCLLPLLVSQILLLSTRRKWALSLDEEIGGILYICVLCFNYIHKLTVIRQIITHLRLCEGLSLFIDTYALMVIVTATTVVNDVIWDDVHGLHGNALRKTLSNVVLKVYKKSFILYIMYCLSICAVRCNVTNVLLVSSIVVGTGFSVIYYLALSWQALVLDDWDILLSKDDYVPNLVFALTVFPFFVDIVHELVKRIKPHGFDVMSFINLRRSGDKCITTPSKNFVI